MNGKPMQDAIYLSRRKKIIYTLIPLFALILCFGSINVIPRLTSGTVEPTRHLATPAIVSDSVAGGEAQTAVPPTLPIPTSTPTPSPPTPTLPPDAVIALLGPPPDSVFRLGDTISFYWDWPQPLSEDQRLFVYLLLGGQEILLGALEEPNSGATYRLQRNAMELVDTAVSAQWLVRLQSATNGTSADSQTALAESETRTLRFAP
ncbi:MAG: hypothetical protein GY803_11055 [Chloroflexi bacterium]|nr:hypothetical protein [Chloroflexota bacterium]